jgi:hypothetical protein
MSDLTRSSPISHVSDLGGMPGMGDLGHLGDTGEIGQDGRGGIPPWLSFLSRHFTFSWGKMEESPQKDRRSERKVEKKCRPLTMRGEKTPRPKTRKHGERSGEKLLLFL